jgi:hypothetical protein
MNITASLVDSYMYADMFNREYEGGSDITERVVVGGVPVEHILPSLRNNIGTQTGGDLSSSKSGGGPFQNKVVPVGLVVIEPRKDHDVEYTDYFHPNASREVVSDSMYDILFAAALEPKSRKHPRRRTPPKTRPLKQNRSRKQKSEST